MNLIDLESLGFLLSHTEAQVEAIQLILDNTKKPDIILALNHIMKNLISNKQELEIILAQHKVRNEIVKGVIKEEV